MKPGLLQTVAESVFLLFLLQSLLALVESGYSFGLLSKDLPPEATCILFLFSPAFLWLAPATPRLWQAKALMVGAVGFRLAFPLAADPSLRLLFAGLSVSCCLILLVILVHDPTRRFAVRLGASVSVSVVTLVLFRVVGSGLDCSLSGTGQFVAWPLALFAVLALDSPSEQVGGGDGQSAAAPVLGLMGCVAIVVSFVSAPTVVARWGDFSLAILACALLAGVWALRLLQTRFAVTRRALLWGNVAFLACLALTLLPQQVDFPSSQDAYPYYADDAAAWTVVPAAGLMFLGPVVLQSAGFFALTIAEGTRSLRGCARAFTLGSVLLMAFFLAQILTITYDYVPVIGPLFRDRFWLVAWVMGLVPFLALLRSPAGGLIPRRASLAEPVVLALLAAAVVGGLLLLRDSPVAGSPDGSLTVVTFNIQQGFLLDGGPGARRQLDALRDLNPDIVGLQESDTNRISSGNQDIVRYFAEKLDMYSYYGPSPVVGSFGVALLSRYPIESPRTFYLWSEGEQTAAISARILVGDRWFDVFVTHLGNGGPLVQQRNVLQEVAGKDNVLLLGDFNFRPRGEQYEAALEVLADSWMRNQGTADSDSIDVRSDAIDYVFASPDITVLSARYIDEGVFDHPIYVVEIAD